MSCINYQNKHIFIHLPKCAGCSMSNFPWNKGSGHDTIYDFSKQVDIKQYFKWCFIRNPWERIVSAYEDCPEVNSIITSFDRFIEILYLHKKDMYIKKLSWSSIPRLGMPVSRIHFFPLFFQISIDEQIQMDFIGRYENLEEDWKKILTLLNQDFVTLARLNSRKNKNRLKTKNYRDLYTDRLINMVAEIYEKDILFFKYDYL